MALPSFIFGGNTGLTPEALKRQRAIAAALYQDAANAAPRDLGSGIAAIGKALAARAAMSRTDTADKDLAGRQASNWQTINDALNAGTDVGGSALAYSPSGAAADGRYTAADVGAPAAPLSTKPGDENIYSDFIGGVKGGGLTNPYGLAAVAATGKAESGYSAGNAYRQWSDPSESGQAGMAGGIMSWRAGRLQAMRDFAAQNGDDPNRPSAKTQAAFFLAEDRGLVQRLNSAKSVEEAQSLMNNAWAFAGHDRPGGEAARRLSTAQSYLPSFMGGPEASAAPAPAGQPVQVASLDPSIGMDSALAYDPRRAAGAPSANPQKDAAVAAALPPLPPGRSIGANPVPSGAGQGFSPNVLAALNGDSGFDGFARSGGNVQGAPAAPAAPGAGPAAAPARAGGMNSSALMRIIADPYASDQQKQIASSLLTTAMKPRDFGFATLPDGTIVRQDPRTGTVTPVYKADKPATYGVIGKDQFGTEQYGWIDANDRTTTPSQAAAGGGGAAAAGASDIPPAPPGIDPKEWRKQFSERAATNAMPAKDEAVTGLRKEIQQLPSYKNFSQAAPIYRAMTEAAGRDTKSADLNLVYGLGKIMDPGSVVREGEIVMANDTQGIADKLNGFIAGIQGEGRLRPEARQQIMQEAFGRLGAYKIAFDQDAAFYGGIAGRNRIPVEDVIPNFGTFEEWKVPTGPVIREVSPSPVAAPAPAAPAQAAPQPVPVPPPARQTTPMGRPVGGSGRRQGPLPTDNGWQELPNGVKIRVKP